MGWFDNDPKDKPRPAGFPAAVSSPSTPSPPAAASAGSTIGERVHISGTIVAGEELTIHGKVDGDIHARRPLRIAKGAMVKALVEGTKVLLEGSLEGNLVASEAAVLGPTARMAGDIKAPSLEVQDGAFVKGSVEMPRPQSAKPVESGKPAAAQAAREKPGVAKPAVGAKARESKGATAPVSGGAPKPTRPDTTTKTSRS